MFCNSQSYSLFYTVQFYCFTNIGFPNSRKQLNHFTSNKKNRFLIFDVNTIRISGAPCTVKDSCRSPPAVERRIIIARTVAKRSNGARLRRRVDCHSSPSFEFVSTRTSYRRNLSLPSTRQLSRNRDRTVI